MIDVMRRAVLVPIHRDGWPFIAAFALARSPPPGASSFSAIPSG
jgi:hypothetical protein